MEKMTAAQKVAPLEQRMAEKLVASLAGCLVDWKELN